MSRRDSTEVVTSRDLPLVLVSGARRERALVRHAVFMTASLTVTRPAADGAPPDRYRWTYRGFLQRQVCFTSMTGLFSCTEPQVVALPDVAEGDAPISSVSETFPLADAAHGALLSRLEARAPAVFAVDRRTMIDPLFRTAGVTVQMPGAPSHKP